MGASHYEIGIGNATGSMKMLVEVKEKRILGNNSNNLIKKE